uniref:Fas-associated death domain protein n=1 Tax=Branchiostoma belcheri TaxID=7741 RepID=B8PZY8_BRABE|nr:Fas-associated death domain protein [Branchiostoma belcheri]ACA30401.1 Fas-associated death domain protein [Branchiostoma belcheri]
MGDTEQRRSIEFKKCLNEIGKKLTDEQLESLKFLCSDFIGRKRQEEITRPLQLFQALEERDKLRFDNTGFLKEILRTEKREDLVKDIETFEAHLQHLCTDSNPTQTSGRLTARGGPQRQTSVPQDARWRELFDIVENNLGRNWRQLARKLQLSETDIECISEDYSRRLREQGRQALLLWSDRNEDARYTDLVTALRRCQLNDIGDQLERKIASWNNQ